MPLHTASSPPVLLWRGAARSSISRRPRPASAPNPYPLAHAPHATPAPLRPAPPRSRPRSSRAATAPRPPPGPPRPDPPHAPPPSAAAPGPLLQVCGRALRPPRTTPSASTGLATTSAHADARSPASSADSLHILVLLLDHHQLQALPPRPPRLHHHYSSCSLSALIDSTGPGCVPFRLLLLDFSPTPFRPSAAAAAPAGHEPPRHLPEHRAHAIRCT